LHAPVIGILHRNISALFLSTLTERADVC
jgi:hypothetical protein